MVGAVVVLMNGTRVARCRGGGREAADTTRMYTCQTDHRLRFRSHYSTCVNATVLHAQFESHRITHVVFLDSKAAFDIVNRSLLLGIL